jgi:hypothetical protein
MLIRTFAILVLAFGVCFVSSTGSAADFALSPSDRLAETKYLLGIGLSLNNDQPLAEFPERLPYQSNSWVLPTSWFNEPYPTTVMTADMVADIDDLARLFQEAYGVSLSSRELRCYRERTFRLTLLLAKAMLLVTVDPWIRMGTMSTSY